MAKNKFAPELDAITEKIIGCAFNVGNDLGVGFSEKIYENALAHELIKVRLEVRQQHEIKVVYDGIVVGNYVADLFVEGSVIVELKVAKLIEPVHVAQGFNYLKATGIKVCLLFNFGRKKVEFRRLVNNF
jgi:GxxExxY protein